jgi:hypothetical protein
MMFCLLFGGLTAGVSTLNASALKTSAALRSSALSTSELDLVGLQLLLPDKRIDVPARAPISIPGTVMLGLRPATAAELSRLLPLDAVLTGTLTGPGMAPQVLQGTLLTGLPVPGLAQEGDYTVSDVRLVQGNKTLLQGQPSTVVVRCLGEILITQVTSTPMTSKEIDDAGIKLGQGNFEGHRFTMTLGIGSHNVNLSVPVAVPLYDGVAGFGSDSVIGRLEIQGLNLGDFPDLTVSLANLLPESKSDSFLVSRPSLSHQLRNNFKALLVIPGSVGYLHQMYRVNVVVFNTLAPDSPYQVSHLTATYSPPPAADGVGPLRILAAPGEGIDDQAQKVFKASAPGQTDGILTGNQSGQATYIFEGLKEGSHPLDFRIQGQFEGGTLAEPIPLSGVAHGGVLIRNPTFNLMLVHPDVVRKGEKYTLEARLTNTSKALANKVSLVIDRTRLTNARLVSDASQTVDQINPGDTAVFKFELMALKNGEVQEFL